MPTGFSTFTYTPVRGVEAEDTVIELDGNWFENCHFRHCRLIFHGDAPFGYRGTTFDACQVVLEGHALLTIRMLEGLAPGLFNTDNLHRLLHTLATQGFTLQ